MSNQTATYLVHLPDGSELGPASLDDLRAWVAAGVIGKTTALSLVGSEVRIPAATVQGLFARAEVPTTSPSVQPQQPLLPPPTLSPIAERTQAPASAIQASDGRGATNFTRTTADAVIGWVGVVLSVLVFLMGIIVVGMEAMKDPVLRGADGNQILTKSGEVYPRKSAWLLGLYIKDQSADSLDEWAQRQGIDDSNADFTVDRLLRKHDGEQIAIVDPESYDELGVTEIDMPMAVGDMAGLVLMWLVNFVMATAFIGLIRSRPWAFSLGIVAGVLGTVTNVMGRALETPSNAAGGFDIGFLVLTWLVPILFGVYCWWRQNSVGQVGRG